MEENKNNRERFQLTEMFAAKVDNDRFFYGIIKDITDYNGNELLFSRIKINNGYICANDVDRKRLSDKVDEIAILVVDKKIHEIESKSIDIFESPFVLN